MAFTDTFDVTFPPDTQAANQLGLDIRNLKLDLQQRMSAISGLSTSLPNIGADAQPANWTGLLFFATDTGAIYQWSGTAWVVVTADFLGTYAQKPTTTLKQGSGAGVYTNATTDWATVDAVNLSYSVVIPIGWKLLIAANGGSETSTANGYQIGLADGVAEITAIAFGNGSAQNTQSWTLNWVINGDGANHTIALTSKNLASSSSISILNNTGLTVPVMVFQLLASN
jgi:hypothetical protein